MYAFHPIVQIMATLVGCYALFLGLARFRSRHLGRRVPFAWNRHVLLGKVAILVLTAGMAGGAAVVRAAWGKALVTGVHAQVAMVMFPLLFFGFLSGMYLDRAKGRGKVLPLVHGACNLIVLGLAVAQFFTGRALLQAFGG